MAPGFCARHCSTLPGLGRGNLPDQHLHGGLPGRAEHRLICQSEVSAAFWRAQKAARFSSSRLTLSWIIEAT